MPIKNTVLIEFYKLEGVDVVLFTPAKRRTVSPEPAALQQVMEKLGERLNFKPEEHYVVDDCRYQIPLTCFSNVDPTEAIKIINETFESCGYTKMSSLDEMYNSKSDTMATQEQDSNLYAFHLQSSKEELEKLGSSSGNPSTTESLDSLVGVSSDKLIIKALDKMCYYSAPAAGSPTM